MKRHKYFFLAFACILLLALFAACGVCKDVPCQGDVELSDYQEQLFPYQNDDMVRFANAAGDTISLRCVAREYFKGEFFPTERPESDCCPGYMAESINCNLDGFNGDRMDTRIDYTSRGYITIISGKLDGVDFSNSNFQYILDSIQLNHKFFHNVVATEKEIDLAKTSIFIENDGLGVVGFIINGEEWALME